MKTGLFLIACFASMITYFSYLKARINMLDGATVVLICSYVVFYYGRLFKSRVFIYCILAFTYSLFVSIFCANVKPFTAVYYSLAYVFPFFTSFALFIMITASGNYKFFIRYVIVTMGFIVVTSIITLKADANASRLLAGNAYALGSGAEIEAEEIALSGVAGYQLVHAIPFIGLGLISVFKATHGLVKMLTVLVNASLFVMVVKSGYSTAVFMYIALIMFGMLGSKYYKVTICVGVLLLIGIMFLWKIGVVNYALTSVKPYLGDSQFADKIEELEDDRNSYKGSTYISARVELYSYSWETFKQNPFFGDTDGKNGGHSGGLDTLAKYGLFGFFLILMPGISAYIFIIRCFIPSQKWYLHLASFTWIIFYYLKAPAFKTQTYTLLSFFPLLLLVRKEFYEYSHYKIRNFLGLS